MCKRERVTSHAVCLRPDTYAHKDKHPPCLLLFPRLRFLPLQAKDTQARRWQIMTVLSPLASCVCVYVLWALALPLLSSVPAVGCLAPLGHLLAGWLDDWVTGWLTDWLNTLLAEGIKPVSDVLTNTSTDWLTNWLLADRLAEWLSSVECVVLRWAPDRLIDKLTGLVAQHWQLLS